MHGEPHDVREWDAGYLVGFRHATEGRLNLLAGKYPAGGDVVDLREWRIQHGRDDDGTARRAGSDN